MYVYPPDCISEIAGSEYNRITYEDIDDCSQTCKDDFKENIYCKDPKYLPAINKLCDQICKK